MANFFEQKNRNVIPNFRSFAATVELGELNQANLGNRTFPTHKISQDLLEWEKDKSIAIASDLLSSAIVAGIAAEGPIKRAAKFVLENRRSATQSQISLAEHLLDTKQGSPVDLHVPTISHFLEANSQEFLYVKIRQFKDALGRFARDPITHTELARIYSILGQEEKAKKSIRTAINLAPDNRYVLRSFVRLCVHYGEAEYAHNFLKKRPAAAQDPWLTSAEIALATLLERDPTLIKSARQLIRSDNFTAFSLAELSSGLGTVELLDGSKRKSRDLFRAALSDPNDNALAQVEWALSRERLFDLDVSRFNVRRKFEALALDAFNNSEWEDTIRHSEGWFGDMPFSKRPILLASHVATTALEDLKLAEAFCKAGLVANQGDPQIVNNLAYTLALDNRPDEALSLLEGISMADVKDDTTRVCLMATKGLVYFRKGNQDLGRSLYLGAIDSAARIPAANLVHLAILNYAREEILHNSVFVDSVMDRVRKMKIDPKASTLKILFDKIVSLYDKNVQKNASRDVKKSWWRKLVEYRSLDK